MATEVKKEIELEIAHVLFIDIVAYSMMAIDDQRAAIEELNQVVQSTDEFQKAESANRLLKIPTGDGMALVFYLNPEAPVECALEISRALLKEGSGQRFAARFKSQRQRFPGRPAAVSHRCRIAAQHRGFRCPPDDHRHQIQALRLRLLFEPSPLFP
jgi:hypothetical protein